VPPQGAAVLGRRLRRFRPVRSQQSLLFRGPVPSPWVRARLGIQPLAAIDPATFARGA